MKALVRATREVPFAVQNLDKLPDEARVNVKVVGTVLGIGDSTVWAWAARGLIPPPCKIGGTSRWTLGLIRKIASGEVTLDAKKEGSSSDKKNAVLQSGFCGQDELSKTAITQLFYPAPATVNGRVLGALLRGERLTHRDCQRRFGSVRLSHHAYVIRGFGWDVQMVKEIVTTSDAARPTTIGVYFLSPAVIDGAGESGQRFAARCQRSEAARRES